jgi:hypothetical protein
MRTIIAISYTVSRGSGVLGISLTIISYLYSESSAAWDGTGIS